MSFIRQLVVLYFISSCSGLCAEEIHVCGEPAAIDLVTELMYTTGEEVEVSFLIPEIVDQVLLGGNREMFRVLWGSLTKVILGGIPGEMFLNSCQPEETLQSLWFALFV